MHQLLGDMLQNTKEKKKGKIRKKKACLPCRKNNGKIGNAGHFVPVL